MATPAATSSGTSGQNVPAASISVSNTTGVGNQEKPPPTAEHDRIAPRVMPTASPLTSNKTYSDIVINFFNTLTVVAENGGQPKRYVHTKFLRSSEAELEPYRASCDQLARLSQYPSDLYKVLDIITTGPPQSTREAYAEIVKTFTESAEVIPALKLLFKPARALEGDDIVIKPFMDWCQVAKNSITFVGTKCRYAVEAVTLKNKAKSELEKLSRMYDELTSTLCNRESVNQQAQLVVWLRRTFVETMDAFFKTHDQVQADHAKLYLRNFQLSNQFEFENFERLLNASNLGLWNNYVNVQEFDIYSLEVYRTISNGLSPFLEKIRTFAPTAYELSQTQAACLSPKMIKLKDDANAYISSDVQSIGQGTSLIKQMDNLRVLMQNLQLSGHFMNDAALGLTQEEFEVLYASCKDKVTSEESKKNLRDHRDKIEAQELAKSSIGSANLLQINPLKGIDTWLSFLRSHQEVVALHENDQIRKAVTLKALHVKEDKAACQDLQYQEMMVWLKSKYDDPNMLVRIVEGLKRLPPATNDKTSYHNLTQFSTAMNQLKIHQSQNKLDKSTRHDLLRILLVREHLMQFIAEEREFEKELKGEDSDDLTDAMSVVSAGNDDDKELRRREFYISRMEHFLSVIRSMCTTIMPNGKDPKPARGSRSKGFATMPSNQTTGANPSNYVCVICKVAHRDNLGNNFLSLAKCPKFKKMGVQARFDLVNKIKYCKRCLKDRSFSDHSANGCEDSIARGRHCPNHDPPSTTHHIMLCLDQGKNKPSKGQNKKPTGNSKKTGYKKSKTNNNATGTQPSSETQSPNPNPAYHTAAQSPATAMPVAANQQQNMVPAQVQQTQSHMVNVGNQSNPPGQLYQTFTPRLLNTTRAFLANRGAPVSHDCDMVRSLMSCATYVTAVANTRTGEYLTMLAMQDTGSGLGFITFDAARQLNLPQTSTWHGSIQTLDGEHDGIYPVFELFLIDVHQRPHLVKLLGVPSIGEKRPIPHDNFLAICHSFGLDPGATQNTAGNFDILLGVDSCHLLADRVPSFKSDIFPHAAVYHSILSPHYFIVGASGSPLDADVRTCTYRCEQYLDHQNHFLPYQWHRQQAATAVVTQQF